MTQTFREKPRRKTLIPFQQNIRYRRFASLIATTREGSSTFPRSAAFRWSVLRRLRDFPTKCAIRRERVAERSRVKLSRELRAARNEKKEDQAGKRETYRIKHKITM
jgi:hypothetical protein